MEANNYLLYVQWFYTFPNDFESRNKLLLLPAWIYELPWMKTSKLLTMDRNITQLFSTNSKKWTMLERTAGIQELNLSKLKFNQNNAEIILIFYTYDEIFSKNEIGKNHLGSNLNRGDVG